MKNGVYKKTERNFEKFTSVLMIISGVVQVYAITYFFKEDTATYLSLYPSRWQLVSYFTSTLKNTVLGIGYVLAGIGLYRHTKTGWLIGVVVLVASCIVSCFQVFGRYFNDVPVSFELLLQSLRPIVLLTCISLPFVYKKYQVHTAELARVVFFALLIHIDIPILYTLANHTL